MKAEGVVSDLRGLTCSQAVVPSSEATERPSPPKPAESVLFPVSNRRKGMMAWITQGLEKVVPQPDLKGKESAVPAAAAAAPAAAAEPPSEVHQKKNNVNIRGRIGFLLHLTTNLDTTSFAVVSLA